MRSSSASEAKLHERCDYQLVSWVQFLLWFEAAEGELVMRVSLSPSMDRLREDILSQLTSFLSQTLENVIAGTHIQLEACVFQDQQRTRSEKLPRREVFAVIDVDRYLRDAQLAPPETLTDLQRQPSSTAEDEHQANTALLPTPEQSPRSSTKVNHRVVTASSSIGRSSARRKEVGGLRLGNVEEHTLYTPPLTPPLTTVRRLEADERNFPKRRKLDHPVRLEQSTVDKIIEGIWEQIHKPGSLALGQELGEAFDTVSRRLVDGIEGSTKQVDFEDASRCCQQITAGSRTSRALEVIVQAHWVDCYDARLTALREERPDLKTYEVKKTVMTEACKHFQWSEKELRNRMCIWKGYREIKDAAGWVALVFAGPGIYRFCKYRMGFDQEARARLQAMRTRAEVAADTLQPRWRGLLSLVGAPTQIHWRGHPHDWVVSRKQDPIPLAFTYRHLDSPFSFRHMTESVVDEKSWPGSDPRQISKDPFTCTTCSQKQSVFAEENGCECFPDLFGPALCTVPPVQVFRADAGKNNGLIACCTFDRGQAIGEFVGLITKGLEGVDVMHGQAGSNEPYQIWQGECGNFTRFINHSCQPNCQFTTFVWMGVQRIIVVSKGVQAGKEITVDYSNKYWHGLDKICSCGETRCRYKSRPANVTAFHSR